MADRRFHVRRHDSRGGRHRRNGAAASPSRRGASGDRIAAIGFDLGEAGTVIDAADRVVAPGFIDLHTHYDAQVFWDGLRGGSGLISPSRWATPRSDG